MRNTIKGALLSGLVFPGLGQLALGKKMVGAGLIMATNIGLAGIIYSVSQRIPVILEQIQPELERGMVDMDRLVQLTLQSSKPGGTLVETASLYIIGGCWLFSVIHAWRLGKELDKNRN